jgi:hypothetical protein
MTFFRRPSLAFAGLSFLCLFLSGCFDSEPAERKALMEFLQVHVLDKPGVHVPKPTAEESKSFGQYAKHYAVITDFTADPEMIGIGKGMGEAMQIGAPRSIKELMDRRQDVKTVRATMRKLAEVMEKRLAETEAARVALQQPADLKAVYSAAFDRDVGDPARFPQRLSGDGRCLRDDSEARGFSGGAPGRGDLQRRERTDQRRQSAHGTQRHSGGHERQEPADSRFAAAAAVSADGIVTVLVKDLH